VPGYVNESVDHVIEQAQVEHLQLVEHEEQGIALGIKKNKR